MAQGKEGLGTEDEEASSSRPARSPTTTAKGRKPSSQLQLNGMDVLKPSSRLALAFDATPPTPSTQASSSNAQAGPSRPRNLSPNASPAMSTTSSISNSVQFENTRKQLNFEPPPIADFYALVESNILPLPTFGMRGIILPKFATIYHEYSWRAQELRTTMGSVQMGQDHRKISEEEIRWWNKLVMILKQNHQVVIPQVPNIQPPSAQRSAPQLPDTLSSPEKVKAVAVVDEPASQSSSSKVVTETHPEEGPISPVPPTPSSQPAGYAQATVHKEPASILKTPSAPPAASEPTVSRPPSEAIAPSPAAEMDVPSPVAEPVQHQAAGPTVQPAEPQAPSKQPDVSAIAEEPSKEPSPTEQQPALIATEESTEQQPPLERQAALAPVSQPSEQPSLEEQAVSAPVNEPAKLQSPSEQQAVLVSINEPVGQPPSAPTDTVPAPRKRGRPPKSAASDGPKTKKPRLGATNSTTSVRSTPLHSSPDVQAVESSSTPAADFLRLLQQRSMASASPAPGPSSQPTASRPASAPRSRKASTPVPQSQPVKVTNPALATTPYQTPRRVIHLGGSSSSQARIKASDASIPVKVIVTPKKRERASTSQLSQTSPISARQSEQTSAVLATSNRSHPSPAPKPQSQVQSSPATSHRSQQNDEAAEEVETLAYLIAVEPEVSEEDEEEEPTRTVAPEAVEMVRPKTVSTPLSKGRGKENVEIEPSPLARSRTSIPPSVASQSPRVSRASATPAPATSLSQDARLIPPKSQAKQKARRVPVDRVVVSIPLGRKRRQQLIKLGVYDAFRDDDSDDEPVIKRRAHISLRSLKPPSRNAQKRSARPTQPENIPERFLRRPGPSGAQESSDALDESTLLRRTVERECGWKGCDAVLASEDLLERHVKQRHHTAQAKFRAGIYGTETLWRCHWYGCEEPCFESERNLAQHIAARHVSRVLYCPFENCEMSLPNISHLSRHVTRHHSPNDPLRPLADGIEKSPWAARSSLPALPESVRTDQLTTAAVIGSIYSTNARRLWCQKRVADNCFGGDDPVLHVEHPPHMLDLGDEAAEVAPGSEVIEIDDSEESEEVEEVIQEREEEEEDVEGPTVPVDKLYNAEELAVQKAQDARRGIKRRWEVVVCIP